MSSVCIFKVRKVSMFWLGSMICELVKRFFGCFGDASVYEILECPWMCRLTCSQPFVTNFAASFFWPFVFGKVD
jgi:hypothetical protein